MTARADVLSALSLVRQTHANLVRNIARHRDAAEVLAGLDKRASFACEVAARRLALELALVKIDLRRVEHLEELSR